VRIYPYLKTKICDEFVTSTQTLMSNLRSATSKGASIYFCMTKEVLLTDYLFSVSSSLSFAAASFLVTRGICSLQSFSMCF